MCHAFLLMGGPLSIQVGLVALLVAYASPGALAAIITTCSDDTSPWSTCVRTEPDGIVFFPKLKAGAWSQHFYEAKYRILGIVERNASYNDVLYEEFFFENCVTKSTSNLLDYYEQVEFCASTTHQEIAYFPIVRVANRNFTSPLTGALIEAGSVQVAYNITWPVQDDETREARVFLKSELRFNLPTSIFDLYSLGVNTFPPDSSVLKISEDTVFGRPSLSNITVNALFNMSWHTRPQLEFVNGPGNDSTGLVLATVVTQWEQERVEAWGKGMLQPTAFQFMSEWTRASETMSMDPWIRMSTGILTSGSLNLRTLVAGCLAAVVVPLILICALSTARCRCCCIYLWFARQYVKVAPNRQISMTRAEKAAYRALHGPFPEDPPTREIIASSRKRAEIKSIKVPVAPKQPEEEKDETQENNVQSV